MNVRAATAADFEPMTELLREDEEHLLGRPSLIGPNDLREWLSRTDLAEDSWLYEEDELCALGWCDFQGELAMGIGVVRPRWKGRGLGPRLLERSERHARERGARRMHQLAFEPDAAAAALLRANGYHEVRRFYDMAIELEAPPAVPDVPIETVREEDVRAFHDALDEAFRDHWEHQPSSFEEWWGRHRANPNLDLGLWFLIRDGDEVVAVARNEANRNGGGYVGALGVRGAWRGRGYAKALLLHTFRVFYERGMPRITLGVDAENPTGATQLYERVGMHVELANVVFEKELP